MTSPPNSTDTVIPIMEEQARVERVVVETGAVRVRIRTERRTEVIDEPVVSRGVSVERIPRDEPVEGRREPWMDGDVMVVPVYREVVVRQTVLVEELRLVPTTAVSHEALPVELASETAVLERQRVDGTWQEVPFPSPPA